MQNIPQSYQDEIIFPVGRPNDAYASYFVGQSYLAMLCADGIGVANVTFEPGCRNNWHIHRASSGGGQILLCLAGHGYYQEEGKEAQLLSRGSVVRIPPNVKHWHGATSESWFTHLALEVPGEGTSTEWLEPVSEEEYAKLGF